jgi:nucleotide-binding universal stress UspA family protein
MSEQPQGGPVGHVVVGVDDSDEARQAAHWAADEASRRRVALQLVSAFTVPSRGLFGYDLMSDDFAAALQAERQKLHREIAAALLERRPDLPITSTVETGHPVDVLLGRSAGAALLVVSTRERGRFRRVIGGSVALDLARHSPVPLAVIRPGTAADRSGPVVVGVDGSANSRPAVALAFEAAAARGVELVALHAWHDDMTLEVDDQGLIGADIDTASGDDSLLQIERALVSEELAGWSEKYPDVVVRTAVRKGDAIAELLEHSVDASLVVVGSRGRGGFKGALLGSTSQALITHADAPVIVVRPADPG